MKSRRREFLAAAAASTVACGGRPSPWRFLTQQEADTLAAVCSRIIPADRDPGATEAGVSLTFNPTTTDIRIEESQTPVAALVDQVNMQITTSLAEETLTNINLAYGNSGTVAVTAPGASQPGKSVLTLSVNFASLAAVIIGKNQLGYARVLSVPTVMSAGSVKTDYRRAANSRIYPLTLSAICPVSQITVTDLTSIATS